MKYSKELLKEIIKNIEEGSSNKDACILAGISEETFYQWLRPTVQVDGKDVPNSDFKPELSESIKKAIIKRKKALINKIITDPSWQARAWYLERQHYDEFGQKQKIEVEESEDKIKKLLALLKQNSDEPIPTPNKSNVQEQGGTAISPDTKTE